MVPPLETKDFLAPTGLIRARFIRTASGAAREPAIRYSVAPNAALYDGFLCRLNWQALWRLPVARRE